MGKSGFRSYNPSRDIDRDETLVITNNGPIGTLAMNWIHITTGYKSRKSDIGSWVSLFVLTIAMLGAAHAASADHDNLVDSIVKAPIVADGDVAFRPADYVINLDVFADPAGPGIAMQAGDKFRIELPKGTLFVDHDEFPVCGVGQADCQSPSGEARICAPGVLACTTAVFLQGYPQSPVPPDVGLDGNILTLTARADIGPVIKQAHFIGKGTSNPRAGVYRVKVSHLRGGDTLASGVGKVRIRRNDHPSINLTSVFASTVGGGPPFANTVLQAVTDGPTDYPWNFLVWDGNLQPFMNLSLARLMRHLYLIRDGRRIVGLVIVRSPRRAREFSLSMTDMGTINTPVIGIGPGGVPSPLTQRYEVQFDSGSLPRHGCYETTLLLFNGNRETVFVGVPTADACATD